MLVLQLQQLSLEILTGNVNATSNLLLQIGGSEKFRVGSSGQLGIGGANYGTSGQVLSSGGSGSAATWQTIDLSNLNASNLTSGTIPMLDFPQQWCKHIRRYKHFRK